VKVPLSWLREFVPIELDVEALADRIDAHGIKVEGIERPWAGLEGVVVAKVLEVRDHPNSDKLCLAIVDGGEGPVQVVVGIRNMVAGDLVPWARPGSRVPTLDVPLGAKPLRGEMSNGMLCSPRELAISYEHETGILILPDELPVGADLKSALGLDDAILDIEVEPNRPDFLSVYGVARETSSILSLPLSEPDSTLEEDPERADEVATVELREPDGCPFYLARVLRGASVGSTPLWAQARLTAVGMRPVAPIDLSASITAPLMGLFGNDDMNPSRTDVDKTEAMLKSLGKTYEFHRYDGAGHNFLNYHGPNYRLAQAKDGWSKIFAFFGKHLG